MKKSNLVVALVFSLVSMTSFSQVFSGSGSMDVEAELVIPLTVSGSILNFQRVAIPATGVRYYHVEGDGNMFSASSGLHYTTADGVQTDFEGSPIVSTVVIKGNPNTPFNIAIPVNSFLSNSNGSSIEFAPRGFLYGTNTYATTTGNSLDANGEFYLSLGGNIKVSGQDSATPSTPGVYTGTTVLAVYY